MRRAPRKYVKLAYLAYTPAVREAAEAAYAKAYADSGGDAPYQDVVKAIVVAALTTMQMERDKCIP